MSNPLDFLDASASQVEEPHVESAAPEPPADRPRDEHGRFASTQAAPEPGPAPEPPPAPAPPSPPAPEPGHVPISAMLDEREKRQALERQLAEYRARAEPPPPLEPTEALQQALYVQNLRVSRKFAERQYGPEEVARVHDWAAARCDADPIFNQQMRASEDPYEAAMQAYNRDRIVAEVTPQDFEAFKAWKAAQATLQAQHPAQHTPAPASPAPRSLATASGNGAAGAPVVPVGDGQAYAALFQRK